METPVSESCNHDEAIDYGNVHKSRIIKIFIDYLQARDQL